ncbi:PREDICTED: multiple inositol polyphosphate phosphatase 1 [Thamnophis sirtalis]|uniref:Multiple inositol polyphosphate phosphatase 1 n=1 Tax=Thamnophis sirtalis TaxID=35019 RepID=A0A6I9YLV0_9SAUR|nr:PREDICTED: multiple inositol polyphosphate phosphatase 1 [Thamnophis sirtalis]
MGCPGTRPLSVPMLLLLLLPLLLVNGEQRAELLSPFFGTKSRYEELHPHLLRDPLSLGRPLSGFPLPPASCTPLQLSAVVRHGTRFPTRKQIEKLARLHGLLLRRGDGSGGGGRCSVAERLSGWEMWYQPEVDGKLAPKGSRDMSSLAKRLASRFPSLLAPGRRLAFTSSSKHRCVESSDAFREGLRQALYGRMSEGRKNGEFGPTTTRLFPNAWPWVIAIVHERSKPISSPVIIQFGHAETLQPLLSLMGYFKDKVPLNASNYRHQSKRKFRTGRIVPYAANLLFVLYHCEQAKSPKDEYKVQILLNEKLLPFTYSGKKVSLYSKLKNHYQFSLQNCEFAKVCSIDEKCPRINS